MARTIFDGDVWASAKKADTDHVVRPTSLELDDGWPTAQYPNRKWDNWAKLAVFEACQWLEEKGVFDWDANITYAQYAQVNYSGTIYISILGTNLNQQPDTATTYWQNYYDWLIEKAGQTMVVADEASLGTGVVDGQIRGTVDGNLYTWDDTDTKWNGRSGNNYASTPAFGNIQWATGSIINIAGGTYRYNGTTWEEIGSVTIGALERPVFIANSASTQIDLQGPGGYHIDGTGWIWWTGTLSYNFTTLAASTISYLYIDESSLSGPGAITNSNLTDSTTAPTYDSTKGGYYNGNDRCIMAVYGLGASSYKVFDNDGEDVKYDEEITELSSQSITTTPLDVTLTVPSFVKRATITLFCEYTSFNTVIYARKNGSTSNGHIVGRVEVDTQASIEVTDFFIDSTLKLEIYVGSNSCDLNFYTNGFKLPKGM